MEGEAAEEYTASRQGCRWYALRARAGRFRMRCGCGVARRWLELAGEGLSYLNERDMGSRGRPKVYAVMTLECRTKVYH
jgi:hypothetical protein